MDKKDTKLLVELCKDARAPISELAKRVRISKEVAAYRLQRMQKDGIITKFIPLINFAEIGYTLYRVQLKFYTRDANYSFITSIAQTSWIVELQGNWDIVVLFLAKTNVEFFDIVAKIQSYYGANLQELVLSIVHTIEHLPANYLLSQSVGDVFDYNHKQVPLVSYITGVPSAYFGVGRGKKDSSALMGVGVTSSYVLSDIERGIIHHLLQDARISVLEMARVLHSSATTITYHLRKLIQQKIIVGFIPLVDHQKLGLTHFKVTLQLVNPADKIRLKTDLRQHPEVIYITESFGRYDLEFEFVTGHIQQLFNFISHIHGEIPIKSHEIIFDNKEILVNEMPQ